METQNPKACDAGGGITALVEGRIVIVERGECPFVEKVLITYASLLYFVQQFNAERAGALAILIISNTDNLDSTFVGTWDKQIERH